MFAAGAVPAAVLALSMSILIYVRAKRAAYKGIPISWPAVRTNGLRALPAMGLPVVMIGGIVGGIGTPTEVSSFAVLYGLILLLFGLPVYVWQRREHSIVAN